MGGYLKPQKEKNRNIKVIPMEWSEMVFLCRKGEPVKNSTYDTENFTEDPWTFEYWYNDEPLCSYYGGGKT